MLKRILLFMLIMLALFLTACNAKEDNSAYSSIYKSKIIAIEEDGFSEDGSTFVTFDMQVEVLEGIYKGQTFYTQSFLDISNYKNFTMYGVGDRINVEITDDLETAEKYISVHSLIRVNYIAILSLLFITTIVIIARIKGFKTIIALVLTIACVIFILIPLLSRGYAPILVSLVAGVVITIFTLMLVGGFNLKTLSAIIGTLLGLISATVLTLIASSFMRITGISTEAVGMILITDLGYDLDIRGIFTAGIIIGCLGAVMDVGMSISSSISEVTSVSEDTSKKMLFKSGMSVGRDIMGTMANTLILAYTGSTIMQMVVWKLYGISFLDMLNREYIAGEVVRAICGSFGMVLSIPITCLVASNIMCNKSKSNKPRELSFED